MGRPKKEISQSNLERFHQELQMAGTRTELLVQDKRGRSRSCLLCRRRKQRCDHKQPSCSTCLKASVKCIQPTRYTVTASDIADGSPSPPVSSSGGYSVAGSRVVSPLDQGPKIEGGSNESEMGPIRLMMGSPETRTPENIYVSHNNEDSVGGGSIGNNGNSYNNGGNHHSVFRPLVHEIGRLPSIVSIHRPKDEYTQSLERKVKDLENLLASQQQQQQHRHVSDDRSSGSRGTSVGEICKNDNILPLPNAGMKGKFLPLKPLSGCSDMGIISGPSQPATLPSLASDSLDSIDFLKCIFAKYNLREFLNYDPAFKFEEQISRSLLETFFSRLQFKYPLLDEDEIYSFHDDYIHSNIYSYSEIGFHFECGRLWLVFSISACLAMTTGKYRGEPPVRYFSKAIRHITRCGDKLSYVQQIELLTLLVLYILRTDRDSLVLHDIIRDAMFICKDKLHLNNWRPNEPNSHKNLRLFWCVYLLERMICVAVGKPYVIAESEINLPLFDEVSFNTRTVNNPKRQNRGVHFINQSLRLRRIESQFVENLHILPDNQTRKQASLVQLPLVQKFFQDLEVWRDNCSKSKIRNFENETLKLYYYRSVRLLIQPYLEFLTPEDKLFRECQAAAGQICQLFKIFHQKTTTGHSTPSVHTVFIAGVTLIYCMWLARNNDDQRRKSLGDGSKHTRPLVSASLFSTMDDLRACSVCLYAMTERSSFARIFRDTFDQLMNATVGNLIERCGPDSSELIYVSSSIKNDSEPEDESESNSLGRQKKRGEDGMPPATNRIFGTRQAEELAAFVEESQVDLEEQKELKRKQGALEQKSVPESLSHLLIKVDTNEEQAGKNELNKVNEGPEDSPSKRRKTKRGSDFSKGGDENQYIVKKPSTSKEFDWKVFQQQAFLQQHCAQQSLQAYLSSLNSSTRTDQNVKGIGESIDDLEKNFAQAISPTSSLRTSDVRSDLNPNIYSLDPKDSVSSTQGSAVSSVWNQNNTNTNTNTSTNVATNINNDPVVSEHCDIAKINKTTPSSKQTSNLFLRKDSDNNTTNLNADILLSNGAQGMINDISTWTTDSVAHLMNENISTKDSPPERNNTGAYAGSDSVQRKDTFHPNYKNEDNTKVSQLPQFFPGLPAKNPEHIEASHNSAQNSQRGSVGFSSLLNNGSNADSSTASDFGHPKRDSDKRPANVRLPPTTASRDFVVEEFWTVNDDYGFLT